MFFIVINYLFNNIYGLRESQYTTIDKKEKAQSAFT